MLERWKPEPKNKLHTDVIRGLRKRCKDVTRGSVVMHFAHVHAVLQDNEEVEPLGTEPLCYWALRAQ